MFLFLEEILKKNIARGTMDSEIDSVTWIEFSNNIAPLALGEPSKLFFG